MLIMGDDLDAAKHQGYTRVYALVLNMMRDRMERADVVAIASGVDELKAFEAGERVAPYSDQGTSGFDGFGQTFHKVYRQGGPLEWYNPPPSMDSADSDFGHGVITLELKPRWTRVA